VSRRHQPSHAVRRKVDIEVDATTEPLTEAANETTTPDRHAANRHRSRARRRRDGQCIDCRRPLPTLLSGERRFDRCVRCRRRIAELTAIRRLDARALHSGIVALAKDDGPYASLLGDLIAAVRSSKPRWRYQRAAR